MPVLYNLKISTILPKKTTILFTIFSTILLIGITISCKKKKENPFIPTAVEFKIPNGFPTTTYNFSQNPLTVQGTALGKKLFYDPQLSSDGKVSCGSCHEQKNSFIQYDHDFAHGINHVHTYRNPQPLVNLAWSNAMGWDGAAATMEAQFIKHFTNPIEMNTGVDAVVQKIKTDASYNNLYKEAFGDQAITADRTLKAIAQFTNQLVSANSKYDQVKNGTTTFTVLEDIGYQVFKAKCNSCHTEPLFTDLSYRSIGLPINPFLLDKGRMSVTNTLTDSIKFKVPTLRNATLTFPYTHDGRYYTLERVIDHYRYDVVLDFNTDALVRNKLNISATEKAGLVAFINTLTDTAFVNDVRFK